MKIIIKGASFKDNNLESTTISKYYSVTYSGDGVSSSSSPRTIAYGEDGYATQDLVATIKVLSSYTFNSVTSVSVGSKTLLTSEYTVSGQTVTVPANKVNGNVVIAVSATAVNTGGGSGDNGGDTPSVPTIYRTNKTLGIQILEFGDFKFQSNSTTQGPSYHCQVVAADVSNYVGKTISISTTHAYIKNNSTYGDAYYCFFLNTAPNNKTPEMLPTITKLSDLGTTSGSSNMDVILNKDIIVEKFDVVSTSDTYSTKSVTVPEGAKYVYFTHTRKGGSDKEANIIFN